MCHLDSLHAVFYSVFVIQQYNLMLLVVFYLIGYDPKVSLLLIWIANSLDDDGKSL